MGIRGLSFPPISGVHITLFFQDILGLVACLMHTLTAYVLPSFLHIDFRYPLEDYRAKERKLSVFARFLVTQLNGSCHIIF